MTSRPAPSAFARHWDLDPDVVFLNHGSFGACPRVVLEHQRELRAELEAEPVRFLARDLEGRLDAARRDLAAFVGCDADDICESVSVTSTCDPAPANTSGRCTCDGANADCPLGQLCRTVTPFNNRCTPNSAANCVNDFVDVNLCPNYCAYP